MKIIKYFRAVTEGKYVFAINLIDKSYSFVVFLLLAREFSPDDFGSITVLFTLSTVFVTIFDLGLPIFLQKETAEFTSRATELFSKVFTISLLIFIIYIAGVIGFTLIFYKNISIYLAAIIAFTMFESSLVNICCRSLSGIYDFLSQYKALWISRLYIVLFFMAGIYRFNFDIYSLMYVMMAGFFLNLVLLFRYLYKNNINYSPKYFSFPEAKAIIKFSIPLGLAVLFNFMYDKIDILLISKFRDLSDVAYYNVGYGLFKASMMSYSFILAAGFTRVSAIGRNKKAVMLFFKKYFTIILIISVAASCVLFALSGWAVKFIYTSKFFSSIVVVQILSAAIIGNALNNLTGIILNGIGLFKAVMYITLFGLIINVVLNIAFIPVYGILASSVITVITEYFIFFFELYYVLKVLNLKKA